MSLGDTNILLAGGGGNLGSWICNKLQLEGGCITILSRNKSGYVEESGIPFVSCDVSSPDNCMSALKDRNYDAVVYMASANDFTRPDYADVARRVNVMGLKYFLNALDISNLRHFIYFSTFHVYGAASGVIDESQSLNPRNDYGNSHAQAESYIRQFSSKQNMPYTILRLTNGYGCPTHMQTDKWSLVLNDLCRSAWEEGEIVLKSNGKAVRDYLWLGDIADVVNQVCLKKKSGGNTFNLCSGITNSVLELAEVVRSAYSELTGATIGMSINSGVGPNHVDTLTVSNELLKTYIQFTVNDKLFDESCRIFKFLKNKGIKRNVR